MWLDSDVLCNE